MKASVESTNIITIVNGIRTREWRGITDNGNPVTLFVYMNRTYGDEQPTGVEKIEGRYFDELDIKDGGTADPLPEPTKQVF